jgi:hypothetical protein
MSILLYHDAPSNLADDISCESNSLYDRWIPLRNAWNLRYQSTYIIRGIDRFLYYILFCYLVYVLERERNQKLIKKTRIESWFF